MAAKSRTPAVDPIVAVSDIELPENEDWYTPQLRLDVPPPQRIQVTLGAKGKGRVRCAIEETGWDRSAVDLHISLEEAPIPGGGEPYVRTGAHSELTDDVGNGEIYLLTKDMIDRLILGLTLVRDEAEKRGLFARRPTPTSIEELQAAIAKNLAEVGGIPGGIQGAENRSPNAS